MANLKEKSIQIKKDVLNASYEAGACHIGSALSCVDILVDLFDNVLTDKDIFLFSKASGVATLYAVLADKGYFPKEKLSFYLKNYPLASKEVPGVIHTVGSLGHGLPIAIGLAYANPDKRVFVLMSDGECQEGTFWEGLLFRKQHHLDNLKIIVDWNGYQACGKIEDVLDLPWDFIKSMGVEVVKTIKGSGVDFMENKTEWHYRNLTEELFNKAICQI